MIVGVLNGYYRSGTTIWQRIIKESNPNIIDLHEPTSPVVGIELRYGYRNIHGWDIYNGYSKLPRATYFEFLRRWDEVFTEQKGIMTDWSDVKYLLEPIHECDIPIFIKSNQLHLFLDKIRRYFKCWTVHIVRDLAQNIYSHVKVLYSCEHYRRRVLLSSSFPDCFFVDYVYRDLTEYFGEDPNAKTVLDKLIYNITKCNEVADSIKVRFEDPEEVSKAIPLSTSKAKELLDPNRIQYKLPRWFLDLFNKVVRSYKNEIVRLEYKDVGNVNLNEEVV